MTTLTADLDDGFFVDFVALCTSLGCKPDHMARCWYSESAIKSYADNPAGHAAGVFQAMPATLVGMNFPGSWADFEHLTARQQLPWAGIFYRAFRGKLTSISACYLATFLPALIDHASDPTYVLSAPAQNIRGWVYASNAAFDDNHDGKIVVSELADAVVRNDRGARWDEFCSRLANQLGEASPGPTTDHALFDLRTTIGIQRALAVITFPAPLAADGILGPKTKAALIAWQAANGLQADGIPGPLTKAALAAALASRGVEPHGIVQ